MITTSLSQTSRLSYGVFANAERVNTSALLRLDSRRLLAPFRREAGLPPLAESYDGWESTGLDGHTCGHVLSALAAATQSTGDERARRMLGRLVDGLREVQHANGDGYLGGVPQGRELWRELEHGQIDASAFDLNGRWVPLYNLHKTLAGLVDVAERVPEAHADDVLDAYGEWWLDTCRDIDDDALERILVTEFGGLTEGFARLAIVRHDARYLDLALRFVHRELLDLVLGDTGGVGRDPLAGVHANTQIPVVVGYATIERAARTLGVSSPAVDEVADAARRFFRDVTARRSTAIGGHGIREQFNARDDFVPLFLAREGPESCNTYNMVKLAAELYELTGDDDYLDFIEIAQVNHVLSTQHPEHGGLVYFTSHRPEHYRVYSPEQDGFWCCMGSGYEAHARHSEHIYRVHGDDVSIARLVASELHLDRSGVTVRVESDYPHADEARVTVVVENPIDFELAVRAPFWAGTAQALLPDGSGLVTDESDWWRVRRRWQGAVTIEIRFDRPLRLIGSPDGSSWGWVSRGPTVLAQRIPDAATRYRAAGARTGHIASGALRPLAGTPIIDTATLEKATLLRDGARVTTADGETIELEPFHRIHDARYRLSWPLADGAVARRERKRQLVELDAASTALEARIVDAVTFGEQQPEIDHEVVAENAERGATAEGQRWLRPRERVCATLRDWQSVARFVRVEWLSDEDGSDVAFRLFADGEELGTLRHDDAPDSGSREMRFETGGRIQTTIMLVSSDGKPLPRLRRLSLMTEAADHAPASAAGR